MPKTKQTPASKTAIKAEGKRVAAKVEAGKSGPKPVARTKLDALGIEWVCDRIANEMTLTRIAAEAEVAIGSLLTWLNADAERSARAREVRTELAKIYDERALEGIEQAGDNFELAKAKEAAHHYRWRAAKIAPREYGDKVAVGGADDLPPINTIQTLLGRIGKSSLPVVKEREQE